jgi:hypothetical protein
VRGSLQPHFHEALPLASTETIWRLSHMLALTQLLLYSVPVAPKRTRCWQWGRRPDAGTVVLNDTTQEQHEVLCRGAC